MVKRRFAAWEEVVDAPGSSLKNKIRGTNKQEKLALFLVTFFPEVKLTIPWLESNVR
jgi:hypothetical protein